jgi:hypothetical protein
MYKCGVCKYTKQVYKSSIIETGFKYKTYCVLSTSISVTRLCLEVDNEFCGANQSILQSLSFRAAAFTLTQIMNHTGCKIIILHSYTYNIYVLVTLRIISCNCEV